MSLLLILGSSLGACSKRESTSACWNARQHVRDTIVDGKLQQAEQLLLQARATCNGQSADDLRRIQELLVDRREAREAMQQAEAARQQALEVPTQRFVHWATASKEQFSKSLVDVSCQERGSPDFGFCTATRQGHPDMRVRYWRSDRSAMRYSFTTSVPLECEDLGEHRRLRHWSKEGTKYELCELTERETRNLSALLVRAAGENTMHLYSFEYLKHDPEFEQLTRERGKQR
jgi:hypothetical protein